MHTTRRWPACGEVMKPEAPLIHTCDTYARNGESVDGKKAGLSVPILKNSNPRATAEYLVMMYPHARGV